MPASRSAARRCGGEARGNARLRGEHGVRVRHPRTHPLAARALLVPEGKGRTRRGGEEGLCAERGDVLPFPHEARLVRAVDGGDKASVDDCEGRARREKDRGAGKGRLHQAPGDEEPSAEEEANGARSAVEQRRGRPGGRLEPQLRCMAQGPGYEGQEEGHEAQTRAEDVA